MSLHKHKEFNPKDEIEKAFESFDRALKQNPHEVGVTFKDDEGNQVAIPKAFTDLVMALNPVDGKKQEAITKELFKEDGKNK